MPQGDGVGIEGPRPLARHGTAVGRLLTQLLTFLTQGNNNSNTEVELNLEPFDFTDRCPYVLHTPHTRTHTHTYTLLLQLDSGGLTTTSTAAFRLPKN